MKITLFAFAVLACCFGAAAQQPVFVQNGKTYLVYPYQQETDIPMRNFRMGLTREETLTRDSLNRKVIATEVRSINRLIPMENNKVFKKYKKVFLAIREEHPGILYNYNITLEKDIVPTLEPLKDGEYVQFYRDLPYVKDGVVRYRNEVVCATFSLKNNQLDGFACWLTADGDTIKAGNFVNGLKEGPWIHRSYKYNPDPRQELKLEGFLNGAYKDTTFTDVTYRNGLLHGPYKHADNDFITETGHFRNGEESGEWHHYEHKVIVEGIKTIYTDEPVLVRHYTIPEKLVTARSVIVRNIVLDLAQIDRFQYEIPYDVYFEPFCDFYSLYTEKEEEGLELPEEASRSYPGEEEEGNYRYEQYGEVTNIKDIDFSYGNYERGQGVVLNGREYSRNDLIDSVGYQFPFEGIYEEFHPNGQLKMRFEVRNGLLLREDTIFWDNGNPVSIVSYDEEDRQYSERTFDYRNKLIRHNLYDEKGNFIRVLGSGLALNEHLINGKVYFSNSYDLFYDFEAPDTLRNTVKSTVVLEEALWKFDTTIVGITTFDPVTRTYDQSGRSLLKEQVYNLNVQFGEDYENVNGKETFRLGKLEASTLINGSFYKSPFYSAAKDTVPNSRVMYWQRAYEIDYDNVLNYDGQPFSGTFSMTTNKKKFGLKSSKNALSISFANGEKHRVAIMKTYRKYAKSRKAGKLAPYMTQSAVYQGEVSSTVLYNMAPFINSVFDPVPTSNFMRFTYTEGIETSEKLSEKKAPAFDKTVEGRFLNGRPEGDWTARDQHGNLTATVPFLNGEVNGEVLYYRTAYPEDKEAISYDYGYYDEENPLLKDSLPAKPMHYLATISHYRNGILNGPYRELNWMGDTVTKMDYVDGYREGAGFEKTKIAFTLSEYEDGELDGIMQTFLTIPGKDTTLLYDLNFQNGRLQGESKSYHLNGNIAKHGFFLGGEPIDDFEAFDTLGFRYQYVKFQFSQPIEEKIWEENELSVRYTFDWRDSIYFNTSDIAGSTSLEGMISELGLGGDAYNRPYYGRPSLVEKTGINYHMTKYYPNDTIARDGDIESGKKAGCWQFFSYEGKKLYEVDYFDTIITVQDSIRFKSKGILTYLDEQGNPASHSYIVEKFEKYDCAHTDHYEVRMLITFWEKDPSVQRMNGYVKNYYDNGVLQNEGYVKDGIATGVWKFYDPYGSLNQVGEYKTGKREGRWLSGDLSQVKYMGDICLNPNLQNLEEIMSYQEKLLDISVVYYQAGIVKKREYYGLNMNPEGPPANYMGEEMYYDEGEYYEE